VRLGIQQTPWVDFEEGIYRYRFQGTVFAERIPLPTTMTSSDAGVSFHYNFAQNYGDVHFGLYNGENYQRVETNNEKGFEFRGTLRPFARMAPLLRGVRAHLVWYADNYVSDSERKRVMGNVTYEHKYVNAGFDYLDARDQVCPRSRASRATGTRSGPRRATSSRTSRRGRFCVRYDHWTPNTAATPAPLATSPIPGRRCPRISIRTEAFLGSRIGSRIRATSARRSWSTTTARASTTSRRRKRNRCRCTDC
jgi:hypothetical protein